MKPVPVENDSPFVKGGSPTRDTLLPYGRHYIDEDDVQAVLRVLRSEWITQGPKVPEFEEAVASWVGARHAVCFSSGTAALHAAAFAAGLGPGDEAVTTPLTFCATANCVLYRGARPVFADVRADTLNIDPEEVARRITPRTRAILPVDYAGHPADLEAILSLAERHGLVVIEDACHALGAEYREERVGHLSDMTVFSFHAVKHLTTAEGGMITTESAEFARKARLFRNHGIDQEARERQKEGRWFYEMVALGYNYRLSDIGCALGLSQLAKQERNLARRREIAERYTQAFQALPGVTPPSVLPGVEHAWHLYPLRFDAGRLNVTRDKVFRALRAENIGVNVHYIPVHQHPYYRDRFGYRGGEYPVAEAAYRELITLPLFPEMLNSDVEDVIQATSKVVRRFADGGPRASS